MRQQHVSSPKQRFYTCEAVSFQSWLWGLGTLFLFMSISPFFRSVITHKYLVNLSHLSYSSIYLKFQKKAEKKNLFIWNEITYLLCFTDDNSRVSQHLNIQLWTWGIINAPHQDKDLNSTNSFTCYFTNQRLQNNLYLNTVLQKKSNFKISGFNQNCYNLVTPCGYILLCILWRKCSSVLRIAVCTSSIMISKLCVEGQFKAQT